MLKRILAARKHVAIGLAVGLTALATGAFADAATGRIRHMADTYLQSDGSQVIDLGILATTISSATAPLKWRRSRTCPAAR